LTGSDADQDAHGEHLKVSDNDMTATMQLERKSNCPARCVVAYAAGGELKSHAHVAADSRQ
jgi:hypothetical protein